MASKTYKQWYEYHLKELRKNKDVTKYASEDALKRIAADQAQRSFDAQEKAKNNPPGTIGGSAGGGLNIIPAPVPTPKTPVVGRNKPEQVPAGEVPSIIKNPTSLSPTPKPTPRVGNAGVVPPNASDPNTYNNRMQARIKALGITGYTNSNPGPQLDAVELMATFSDAQYAELAKVLKGLGYNVKEKGALKQTLINYFEEVFPAKNYADLLAKLKGRAIAGTGTDGAGKEPDLGLRQKSQVDKGTLVNIAQTVAMNTLMRRLTPEEEKAIVTDWSKKQAEGVYQSPAKKVKNKKTGKMENVVTTTRGFQQDTEELALQEKLKKEDPTQYQLAQGIGFIDELKQILSGGM